MHCLYSICERKCYVRTHVKITRQWKSTLDLSLLSLKMTAAQVIERVLRGGGGSVTFSLKTVIDFPYHDLNSVTLFKENT